GPKQNINGPYAAVIPIFITNLLQQQRPTIFGDGSTTRDFTFVENVVQANLKAAFSSTPSDHEVFNIAYGGTTSLNELFSMVKEEIGSDLEALYAPERKGDIKDSFAQIKKAKELLDYVPTTDVRAGIA